ncbi:MAG TPA: HAD-IC family P-type ATPase [Thermomicrobiales bacterium]|nr:HAD-IC family P-type ATPase [Thermomicrobiales bacterium]
MMQTEQHLTTDDSDDQAALQRSADEAEADSASDLNGLTEAEVQDRRKRGLANVVSVTNTRSYLEIIRRNAFTLINVVLYATCAMLVAMGLYGDALVTVGLVLFNVVISIFQEIRTKRTLDRISVLTWPKVTVRREGQDQAIDPTELVQDDLLLIQPGDQIVADGPIVDGRGLEVDESLLTGEADAVAKNVGDKVLSGTFCVSGTGMYRAETVGQASVANRLTSGARAYRQSKTPMQQDMDLIVRAALLAVLLVGGPVLMDLAARAVAVAVRLIDQPSSVAVREAFGGYPIENTVRSAAVILALVPQGLALMIAVTYAAAAMRLVGSGVLVQQTNAMESLSHVDVLCLDKTGTLTTNQLEVVDLQPIGADKTQMEQYAGDFAANMTTRNKTSDAIGSAFSGQKRTVVGEVPFSSARKWSCVSIDDEQGRGLLVLGAPDVLASRLSNPDQVKSVVDDWSGQGRRVVLLAGNPDPASIRDTDGEPELPELDPIGVIGLVDSLRQESRETLKHFSDLGVNLKLISGDDPRTVAALARQVGFPVKGDVVSGLDLPALDDEAFRECARQGTVFGRTTPDQKERLIQALQQDGRYVAMTGDGVNDVPALKRANMGIAMRSGSDAARGVADLVLLDDSFGALPRAFAEGQRIVAGMQDIAALFVVRSLSVMLILFGAAFVNMPFPLSPRDNALLATLTVGLPTLGLAAWAKPRPTRHRLLRPIAHFSVPAALTIAPVCLVTFMIWWRLTKSAEESQTILTATAVLCGLVLLPFVEPPVHWLTGGDEYSGDWRPTFLAVALLGCFLVVNFSPGLRLLFDFSRVPARDLAALAVIVAGWAVFLRWAWRYRLFERLSGLDAWRGTKSASGSAPIE